MAAISSKYPFGSPQERIPMCEKHDLAIDITCEHCDEFICSQCAKTDHKDHDWKTIPTAGIQRRINLKKTLSKVREIDIIEMNEMIQKANEQIENNNKSFMSEVIQLQIHFEAIVSKLDDIKKNFENTLRKQLKRKNDEVEQSILNLENAKKDITEVVEVMEKTHSTMSDYSLIDKLRNLKSLLSNRDSGMRILGYPLKYQAHSIKEELLESMMGEIVDLDGITATKACSFQRGYKPIDTLETINDEYFVLSQAGKIMIKDTNKFLSKNKYISSNTNDACVTDSGDIVFTDFENKSISCFSLKAFRGFEKPMSKAFSTRPFIPYGICQVTLKNPCELLVTLINNKSEKCYLDSHSRRLIRHVTLTGDVIREYEYQEDGKTRLFTLPVRVKQNENTDICVINKTSDSTSGLMILSFSGHIKVVYRGHSMVKKCLFSDVVCDSRCNIIVSDMENGQIHLLSPNGAFVKYLLTQDEITHPSSMSLFNSTLLVGNNEGLVKKFVTSKMKLPRNCTYVYLPAMSAFSKFYE